MKISRSIWQDTVEMGAYLKPVNSGSKNIEIGANEIKELRKEVDFFGYGDNTKSGYERGQNFISKNTDKFDCCTLRVNKKSFTVFLNGRTLLFRDFDEVLSFLRANNVKFL